MKKYVFESLKFFCAAILCTILTAFATSAFANCNLFDINNPVVGTGYNVTKNGNNIVAVAKSGTSSASRIMFFVPVSHFKPNTRYYISTKADKEFYATYLAIGIAQPNSGSDGLADYGRINGKENNGFSGTFKITDIGVNQEYVSFFYYLGEQPEGTQITISDIMITEGSTAPTEYTPYNPLCATCDGTIVNYTSATGTVVQDGTPTPTNPIEPTFYKQGNMILRKVGDIADSYDASTGKITRRVGVKVLDGTESWSYYSVQQGNMFRISIAGGVLNDKGVLGVLCNSYEVVVSGSRANDTLSGTTKNYDFINNNYTTLEDWKAYIAQQYANGTPVTIYYPLETETTENWTETSYCETPIKIATTKYNESAFGPLNTALANAISVVDTVVSNTITQAASIATLQAQKQTRPADDPSDANNAENCPAGKKCLLVEDASGVPHWYEIVERYSRLPDGYTELEYVDMLKNSHIKITDLLISSGYRVEFDFKTTTISTDLANYIGGRANGVAAGGGFRLSKLPTSGDLGAAMYGFDTEDAFEDRRTLFSNNTRYKYTYDNGVCVLESGGSVISSHTLTINDSTSTQWGINSYTNGSAYANSGERIYVYSVKVWNTQGELVMNLIPAKNASGVVGMYDAVGNRFYTNAGTGEFVAGPVAE